MNATPNRSRIRFSRGVMNARRMNPRRMSSENIFCQPAVMTTTESHAIGSSVTHAYRALPILMMTVVPTHNATIASS